MDLRRRLVTWMLGIACMLAWVSPRAALAAVDDDGVYDDHGHCVLPARRDGPSEEQCDEAEADETPGIVARGPLVLVDAAHRMLVRPNGSTLASSRDAAPALARGPPRV